MSLLPTLAGDHDSGGGNPRCFNGLPYHCGFPQVRIVCQQIRGAFRSQFCGRQSVNAVLIAIENRDPPSAELEAGGRVEKHSNGMPRICWHTIPYLWEPTVVRQAIETAWTSVSSGRTFVEVLVPAG